MLGNQKFTDSVARLELLVRACHSMMGKPLDGSELDEEKVV